MKKINVATAARALEPAIWNHLRSHTTQEKLGSLYLSALPPDTNPKASACNCTRTPWYPPTASRRGSYRSPPNPPAPTAFHTVRCPVATSTRYTCAGTCPRASTKIDRPSAVHAVGNFLGLHPGTSFGSPPATGNRYTFRSGPVFATHAPSGDTTARPHSLRAESPAASHRRAIPRTAALRVPARSP